MELRSRRLVLRELLETDAPAANRYERDHDTMRYMSSDVLTLDGSLASIRRGLGSLSEVPRTVFDLAITLDGVFVGRAGFAVRSVEHRNGELWWVVDPDHQGRGIASEAAGAFLDFAFTEAGLHRMYADMDPRNHASIRVADKLGMQCEGRLRETYWLKGEWCDSLVYAVLADAWRRRA